jgi:hypothetical protein
VRFIFDFIDARRGIFFPGMSYAIRDDFIRGALFVVLAWLRGFQQLRRFG